MLSLMSFFFYFIGLLIVVYVTIDLVRDFNKSSEFQKGFQGFWIAVGFCLMHYFG